MADINSRLPTQDQADGATGSATPTEAILVGGSDGTDLRAISTNSSGQVNINNISGTVSLPTGAATSANQTAVIGSATGGTAAVDSELIGGVYNSTLPTLTNGQQAAIQLDSSGRQIVSPILNASMNFSSTLSSTGNLFSQSGLLGYTSFTIALTGTWSATITVTASEDGTNYFTVPVTSLTSLTQGPISSITGNDLYFVEVAYGWIKVAATSYTSGTIVFNGSIFSGSISLPLPDKAQLQDNSGNGITSTTVSGTAATKQPLDVTSIYGGTSRYFTTFSLQQSAATAANSSIFSMRNAAASTKTVYIERISGRMGFNPTNPVTRTQQTYIFQRFSAATPTGGTALTAAQGDSSDSASQVTDIRFLDTGLTTTGVTFVANNFATLACDTTQGIAEYEELLLSPSAIKLAPGEGLVIRLGVAAVTGTALSVNIAWREQ
jgi:hypothetical protein